MPEPPSPLISPVRYFFGILITAPVGVIEPFNCRVSFLITAPVGTRTPAKFLVSRVRTVAVGTIVDWSSLPGLRVTVPGPGVIVPVVYFFGVFSTAPVGVIAPTSARESRLMTALVGVIDPARALVGLRVTVPGPGVIVLANTLIG